MNQKTIQNIFLYGALALYFLYGLSYIGLTGILFSVAIGLIGFSFHMDFKLVVAAIILSGILWNMVLRKRCDGFSDSGVPVSMGDDPSTIIGNIKKFQNKAEPQPTLSSHFSEGFSDSGMHIDHEEEEEEHHDKDQKQHKPHKSHNEHNTTTNAAIAPSSIPAPVSAPTTTPQLAASVPSTASAPPQTSGFQDSTTSGMFKLGSLPPDAVGGSHIDIGTTLMNALNSLKPDQIKTMTDDTRKLMETQTGLMGMLSSMKPMLQDGKDIMKTFQDMFGQGGMAPSGKIPGLS